MSITSRELIAGNAPLCILADSLRDYGTPDCERFAELCDIQTTIRMSPNPELFARKAELQKTFESRVPSFTYSNQFGPFWTALTYHYEPTQANSLADRMENEMIESVVFANFTGGPFNIRVLRQACIERLTNLALVVTARNIDWTGVFQELNGINLHTLQIVSGYARWPQLVPPFTVAPKIAAHCELSLTRRLNGQPFNKMRKPSFSRY